ncbi:hypothetical protein NUU61_004343 [Penicillium alfredii]|uniref:N-acetylgalactosaminide beta-1,3-galactosyltransferase n=1 Tax=Penicillium alfredii TaxID=1506179 RepID=A0A9W9KDS3_9EURO|nr:uncharacterized protein NUU61_004343 [Penicillium alfredii]KAJ5102121.1 hypothetical protein NUU61_004343 [Penicillium alfredii]
MSGIPARYGRWGPILAPFIVIALILHFLSGNFGSNSPKHPVPTGTQATAAAATPSAENQTAPATETTPACPQLKGMDDVLVVLKTGITESQEKVPVHLRTTLRCIPHKVVVSDFEEDIGGLRTLDVFHNMSESIKQNNEDFALYLRARDGGRDALLAQDHTKVANSASGMSDNPGWKLDKWKFLPMIHTVRHARPDARWYVFIEADTYPIWPNLLGWLSHWNPEDKLYLGNQMQIGDITFAHGGSGFVLSNPALNAVADMHAKNLKEWDQITEEQWAGDCVLGMALTKVGIDLTWSSPHVTTQSVWEQDAFGDAWCHPPFTFHHMTPADVDRMWEFEQQWFSNEKHKHLLYRDIFRHLVRPTLADYLNNWDNKADRGDDQDEYEGPETPASLVECADYCAGDTNCMQYRLDGNGRCTTSPIILRGTPEPGMKSGNMMWRVDAAIENAAKCKKAHWVRP